MHKFIELIFSNILIYIYLYIYKKNINKLTGRTNEPGKPSGSDHASFGWMFSLESDCA